MALVAARSNPAFTKSYTSSNQTITAAGSLTLAHGLGAIPTLVQLRIKCTSGEGNYSVGDELIVNNNVNSFGAAAGVSIVPDATNLNIRFAAGSPVYSIPNKTTGAAFSINTSNWVAIFKAWV